ncbi:peptide deformylase [Enterobacter cloacae subsp. cloacae]|nr:peptide deformylase [Enterobacter cloacae subsp. cloacae]
MTAIMKVSPVVMVEENAGQMTKMLRYGAKCCAGWRCAYPAYGFTRPGKRSATERV